MKWFALSAALVGLFVALCVPLPTSPAIVGASAPPDANTRYISVYQEHYPACGILCPHPWHVVVAQHDAVVASYRAETLDDAKWGLNKLLDLDPAPAVVFWHDLYQARVVTDRGDFTSEELDDQTAIESVTALVSGLGYSDFAVSITYLR
jgi:hypothetical protein